MSANSVSLKVRDARWDVLKGIGMILVIASHALVVDYSGFSIIGYAAVIAIPIFFFISGFFMSKRTIDLPFGTFLWKKVKTIFIPYTVFFILSFLFVQTVLASQTDMPLFGYAFSWTELLKSYLFAGKFLFEVAVVPPPIWFLHALFFASIPCYFIFKIKRISILTIIMILLMAFTIPLQSYLGSDNPYWIVKLLPPAISFMIMGTIFNRIVAITADSKEGSPQEKARRLTVAGFVSMAVFVASVYAFLYGGGDMWSISTFWYFLAATGGIVACYLLSIASDSYVLRYIGENSLYFLGLHPLILITPFVSNIPEALAKLGLDGFLVFLVTVALDVLLTGVLVVILKFVFTNVVALFRSNKSKQIETDFFEIEVPETSEPNLHA